MIFHFGQNEIPSAIDISINRYLALFSRSLGHFIVTQAKILPLSRTSICRTFRYLKLIFRSIKEQTLVISNFSNEFHNI